MNFDEFKEMFNATLYDKVRASLPLCEDAFPNVFQKVSREGRNGVINQNNKKEN
jgi:delta24-sterol reductase